MTNITVHLDNDLYDQALRAAEIDQVSVTELVEVAMRRHLAYREAEQAFAQMPAFSLDSYELQRDPDESDADYALRQSLFR